MNRHWNNKDGGKTGHIKGREIAGGRGEMKRVKEGEYGSSIFYTHINMEHWKLLKSFWEG
jgi:hypothetical protein